MKKNVLLKTIFIMVLVLILGSWLIPSSLLTEGEFVNSGYNPLGLIDVALAPFHFFNCNSVILQLFTDGTSVLAFSYSGMILLIFATGIFYSVLKKTGAYGKLIDTIQMKVKEKKTAFLFATAIFFFLFSSLIGVNAIAFVLIPFFVTILLKLDYSRITCFAATFLSCMVGNAVSILGSEVAGINNVMYSLKVENYIGFKIFLFLVVALIFLIYLYMKKVPSLETEEEEEIPKREKSYLPIILLCSIFFFVFLVGCYNAYYVFQSTSVTDVYENLMSSSVGNYPIAQNLFGKMEPFGYWSEFTLGGLLLILSAMIGFVYAFTFDDMIECVKKGIKRMLKPACYVVLAATALVLLKDTSAINPNFLTTIVGFFKTNITKLAIPFSAFLSVLYGFFVGNYQEFQSLASVFISNVYEGMDLFVSTFMMQIGHGIMSMVAPSSLLLVAGLSYLKIPYQKWLSYIWRLALLLFLVSIAIFAFLRMI